jgi:nucleoside-diphosphate-sugar epimerase
MVDFDLFNRNAGYPDDKVRNLLGYQPEVNLDTGLSLTVAWMRQVGLIN